MSAAQRLPTLYIPHGGGPCFFMDMPPGIPADTWDGMAAYLRSIDAALNVRPKAVLVISAHWETAKPALTTAVKPTLLFDYYGFPEHTYRLTYPVPGAPEVASEVGELLAASGFQAEFDAERGLDHGVFIPFKLIYPDASIPTLQLSLLRSLDPAEHIRLGVALAPLRDRGVLIVGSGMSYHNLRDFYSSSDSAVSAAARFDAWLTQTMTGADTATRNNALSQWQSAPCARECHPRSEHLIPLMVAAGAAREDRGVCTFKGDVFGKTVSGFQFG